MLRTNSLVRQTAQIVCVIGCFVCAAHTLHAQQQLGRIEGRIIRPDGDGVSGASVVLNETSTTEITGLNGEFSFGRLPPGVYSLTAVLGDNLVTVSGLQVASGVTTGFEETVDWDVGLTDTLTVLGPARPVERIVEAPSATTVVPEAQIERSAAVAAIPKLLEFTPGAQVTQGGVWDYNFSTRGFNSNFSRRVAVLIDGRDQALPFLGFPVWSVNTFPFDDLAGVDFVRGPGAALYGANASAGVINLTTKEPRFNQGGNARVTFGQLGTLNFDTRWSGELGNDWYFRLVGGVRHNELFAVSRVEAPEYSMFCAPGTFGDCLLPEVSRIDDDFRMFYGGIRLDKYLDNGLVLTFDAGHSQEVGGVYLAAAQRIQTVSAGNVPYASVNLHGDRFNVVATYNGLISPGGYQLLLAGGVFPVDYADRIQLEGQTNWSLREDTVQVVVGGVVAAEQYSAYNPDLDSSFVLDRSTVENQTSPGAAVESNRQAAFGQAAWDVSDRLRLVLAGRGDWGSLHEFQLSPKAMATYSLAPDQDIRFGYSRAFQVANAIDFFVNSPVAAPADLSGFEAFCAPFDVECGFGDTPVLAIGNEGLEVEKINTWEVGYRGVIAERAFVTVDYYQSRSSNRVTGILPQLGTPLGRLNPAFGPWQGPDGLPEGVVNQIRTLTPILSNDHDGSNVLVAASLANYGDAKGQGIDLGVNYYFPSGWQTAFTYSWFDFESLDPRPGVENLYFGNAPSHAFSVGGSYTGDRIGGSLDMRWVDEFRWSDSFFLGDVPQYTTFDLAASYQLSDDVSIGLNVANLFDNRHWESFGGSILRRRALVNLQYGWQ